MLCLITLVGLNGLSGFSFVAGFFRGRHTVQGLCYCVKLRHHWPICDTKPGPQFRARQAGDTYSPGDKGLVTRVILYSMSFQYLRNPQACVPATCQSNRNQNTTISL